MYEFFCTFVAQMKTFIRNILFVAVALLYTLSTMGYGIHRCKDDGTASLIVLFGETPCDWVHSHTDEHGNTYTHVHNPQEHGDCGNGCHDTSGLGDSSDHNQCNGNCEHSSNCCSTSVYVLTAPQNTTEEVEVEAPSFHFLGFAHIADLQLFCSGSCAISPEQDTEGDSSLKQESFQQILCTFRV